MNTNHPKIGAYSPESAPTTPKIGFLYAYSNIDPVAAISTITLSSRYAGHGSPPFASAALRSSSRRSQIGTSSSGVVAALVDVLSTSSVDAFARVATRANASTDDVERTSTSAATTPDDDVPIWERRELERKAADAKGGLPWPAYLLLSVIVLIAATGSMFEYAYKNPIFGVVGADSGLYAPILGWFVFTGFPLAGFFWKKGIDGANEASEAQDKMDGY